MRGLSITVILRSLVYTYSKSYARDKKRVATASICLTVGFSPDQEHTVNSSPELTVATSPQTRSQA
jgi:hypothetical protein